MEEIKQEALNILMVAKEIQQETGCTFENAIRAIELGERVANSAMYTKIVDFGIAEYKTAKEEAEAQRAEYKAQREADKQEQAEYCAKMKAEQEASEAPDAKTSKAKV